MPPGSLNPGLVEDAYLANDAGEQLVNHGLVEKPSLAKEVGEESAYPGLVKGPDLVEDPGSRKELTQLRVPGGLGSAAQLVIPQITTFDEALMQIMEAQRESTGKPAG